jgi:glycine/D-amino acid oxidase-like deaminating enzyme
MRPSFWLDQLEPQPARPSLPGDRRADVCIVGAGFTGMWTALELRRADPNLEVIVLEAEHAGFGASGRNGGWVLGALAGSPRAWRRRGGADAPARMAAAIEQTVGEIGRAIAREEISCDWHHGGSLTIAQSEPQLARLRRSLSGRREWRGPDDTVLLDAAALCERIGVANGAGALYTPWCARVQPARLAAGLAPAAERAGATIFEGTRVLEVVPGGAGRLPSGRTRHGTVTAEVVILATEGYTADLPDRHRTLLPLNSAMIVTDPLPEDLWERIGWGNAETVLDGNHLYTYSQRTADGRIAIGGRGVPYRFGSRTDREGPVPPRTVAELRERLAAILPVTAGVPVARAWAGVLGVARDWCPSVGYEPQHGIAHAWGYAGEGVAASNLAARTLRDLVLGRASELTSLPWVGPGARGWEPEPLRFLGARGIHRLYGLADARERRTGRGSRLAVLADAVAGR